MGLACRVAARVEVHREGQWQAEFEHLGDAVDISRNIGTLRTTLEATVAVVQVPILVLQILRLILGVLAIRR